MATYALFLYTQVVPDRAGSRGEMHTEDANVGRYQINLTMGEQLREAVLFSAMRDGMTGSGKIRQILTQQLTRTMQSADFLDYLAARQQRTAETSRRGDGRK